MLGDKDAAANIAVKNLEKAKKFYEKKLGLTQVGAEGQEVIVYKSGSSTINVYQSQYAGTNQATAVTWTVGADIENIVQALKAKDITLDYRTTIPNEVVQYLGIKLGDVIDWEEYQERGKKYARVRKLE